MTLGHFAMLTGARPRWVQNARAVLGLSGPYDLVTAKQLGLAREIAALTGMPLVRAYPLAVRALAARKRGEWSVQSADSTVRLVVDVHRYLSAFNTRLAVARGAYAERARGRRRARPRDPAAAATAHGVDVTLIDENLQLTPAERLRRLDEMSEFFRTARIVSP